MLRSFTLIQSSLVLFFSPSRFLSLPFIELIFLPGSFSVYFSSAPLLFSAFPLWYYDNGMHELYKNILNINNINISDTAMSCESWWKMDMRRGLFDGWFFWLFWVLSVFALAQLIGFAANELITSFYRLSLSVMVHHTLFAPHPCRLTLLTRVFSASLPFPFMIIIIIIRAFRFSAPCLCSNEWSLSCNKQLWSSVYIISNKYVFPSLTMIKHSKKKLEVEGRKKTGKSVEERAKVFLPP